MGCRQEQTGEERAPDQVVGDVFLGRSETANSKEEDKAAAKCLVVSESQGCWQNRYGLIPPLYIPTTQSDREPALSCSMALYYVPSATHTHTHKGAKWPAGLGVEMPFNTVPDERIVSKYTDYRREYPYPSPSPSPVLLSRRVTPLPVSSQHIHSTYLFRQFSLLRTSKVSRLTSWVN
jgi:hypothetical protein